MIEESNFLKQIQPSLIRVLFEKSKEIEGVVSLGIGEPEKTTPQHIIKEAKNALDEGQTHYTANLGISQLRHAIADKYKEKNIEYNSKNEIMVTCGGYEALFCAASAFVNPGDNVVIPNPSWVGYASYVKLLGGNIIELMHDPDNNFSLDLASLEDIFKKTSIKLMFLNSPSNPTGYAYSKEEVKSLTKIAREHNTLIIFDEVYEEFTYDGREHISPAQFDRDNVITVNSFSKSYAMTGWRVGYACGPSNYIKSMNKVHQYATACTNTAAQYGAVAALKSSQKVVKEMITEYDEKRKLTIKKLNEIDGITCPMPPGTFYAFPKFEIESMNSYDLSMYLLENHKVVVIPGIVFGSKGENHFRVSYATSFDEITEGIKRIKEGIESLVRKK